MPFLRRPRLLYLRLFQKKIFYFLTLCCCCFKNSSYILLESPKDVCIVKNRKISDNVLGRLTQTHGQSRHSGCSKDNKRLRGSKSFTTHVTYESYFDLFLVVYETVVGMVVV